MLKVIERDNHARPSSIQRFKSKKRIFVPCLKMNLNKIIINLHIEMLKYKIRVGNNINVDTKKFK